MLKLILGTYNRPNLMTQLDMLLDTLRSLEPGEAEVTAPVTHTTLVIPDARADVPGGHTVGGHVLGVGLLLTLEGLRTPGCPGGAVLGWGAQVAVVMGVRRHWAGIEFIRIDVFWILVVILEL